MKRMLPIATLLLTLVAYTNIDAQRMYFANGTASAISVEARIGTSTTNRNISPYRESGINTSGSFLNMVTVTAVFNGREIRKTRTYATRELRDRGMVVIRFLNNDIVIENVIELGSKQICLVNLTGFPVNYRMLGTSCDTLTGPVAANGFQTRNTSCNISGITNLVALIPGNNISFNNNFHGIERNGFFLLRPIPQQLLRFEIDGPFKQ